MCETVENWREDARAGRTHEPIDITVELDGLGRQLSELPGGKTPFGKEFAEDDKKQGNPDGGAPVFVDASGRRSKKIRRLGWGVAVLCAVYAITLVAALVGGGSTAPLLNIPGVPDLAGRGKPAQTVRTDPSASASTAGRPGHPAPVPSVTDADGNLVPNPDPRVDEASDGRPAGPGPGASGTAGAIHGGSGGAGTSGTSAGGQGTSGSTSTTGGSTDPRSGSAPGGTGSGASGAATGEPSGGSSSGTPGGTGTTAGASDAAGGTGETAGTGTATGGDAAGGTGTGTTSGSGDTATGAPGDTAGTTAGGPGTTGAPDTSGSRTRAGEPAGDAPSQAAPPEGVV
jgi:hypothetical protein